MTDTTPQPAPETPIDRAALSAKLWEIAEHHIVAEWICCEPLEPRHDLCAKGYAALGMAKTLLVDSPEAWNPAAPLLDAIIAEQADQRAYEQRLREQHDLDVAELNSLRDRVRELERPAVEAKRAEIRSSYVELIAQAEQDRDFEGAFDVQCRLREREEQWAREDAAAEPSDAAR